MQDPCNSIMPDFNSVAFQLVKETLMAAWDIPADEAVGFLEEGWTADWREKVAQWEQRQQQPPPPPPQPPQPPPQPPHPPQIGPLNNAEGLPVLDEDNPKRKTKLKDFEENSVVQTTPASGRPSKYALKKLTEFEYVELYYFTIEACRDAAEHERSVADDAFTISKTNDTMALRPMNAYKSSSKAVPDHRLTWTEISTAKTKLLRCMQDAKWPTKHIESLAGLYVNLDAHEIREEESGEETLVHYQAEVRCEWMDAITGNGIQRPFDISCINENRLRLIATKILHQKQLNVIHRSVKTSSPFDSAPAFAFASALSIFILFSVHPHAPPRLQPHISCIPDMHPCAHSRIYICIHMLIFASTCTLVLAAAHNHI